MEKRLKNIISYAQKIGGAPGVKIVERAYYYASEIHIDHKRDSGEPYINHCISVSQTLCSLNVDVPTVAAGILHDVLEEIDPITNKAKITINELEMHFGKEIASLVNGVTKLDISLDMTGRQYEAEAESFRKMFLAMAEDLRIVIIKLADRLHNMKTISVLSSDRQQRLAKETLEIWAPLANRLGIWQIKGELEDLSFRVINPDIYQEINSYLSDHEVNRQREMEQINNHFISILKAEKIIAEVIGRPKHIYSIYKKKLRKDFTIDKIYDIRAIRIIVRDIQSCYMALGIIHLHWRPIPGEFDDYIAVPKDNGYRSLHTAVIYDDGKALEAQIRTHEMDEEAEYGIAAHWKYKEGGKPKNYDQKINWLRMMNDWRQEENDAKSFLDGMKTDVFQDRVYVFTPRGDIIDLSAGSTPIDFAYYVHTDIGHRCRGARVNGKLVSLDYELKTGDQVDILTAKRGGPSRDWLNTNLGLVKTQRARSKIRVWFKKQDHEQNLASGRAILERELSRLGMGETNFEKLARGLEFRTPEDLYVALGTGDLSVSKIVKGLSDAEEDTDILTVGAPTTDSYSADAVDVVGLKGLLTNVAKCCNPTPGDEIVGYITRGRGATIHRQDCPNILGMRERERLVAVSWGSKARTYAVPVRIHAYDRQGLMGDISNLLNNENINIADVNVKTSQNLADIRLTIEVRDIEQLSRILTRIENLPNVMEAQRTKPG